MTVDAIQIEADRLIASGYCPVSNKHRMVARLDRPDWLEHMARQHTKGFSGSPEANLEQGMSWTRALGDGAADHYRRVHSRDQIEGVHPVVFAKVKAATPGSGWGGLSAYRELVLPKDQKAYRVHRQATAPHRFDTLAGAILYIGMEGPMWYVLEQWDGKAWRILIDRAESNFRTVLNFDPGVPEYA